MNKKLKKELQFIYGTPEPVGKREFLKKIDVPGMGYPEFLRSQMGYIRKWNWVLAATIFAGGVCLAVSVKSSVQVMIVAVLAVLFSFLAMSAALEGARALQFGMEELELTTRFSRKTVLAARFTILGLENLILFAIIFPVMTGKGQYEAITTAVILLFPYLFTCFLSLIILRSVRGRESVYYCCCAAVGSCLLVLGIVYGNFRIFRLISPDIWGISILILGIAVVSEIKKALRLSEELIWNL